MTTYWWSWIRYWEVYLKSTYITKTEHRASCREDLLHKCCISFRQVCLINCPVSCSVEKCWNTQELRGETGKKSPPLCLSLSSPCGEKFLSLRLYSGNKPVYRPYTRYWGETSENKGSTLVSCRVPQQLCIKTASVWLPQNPNMCLDNQRSFQQVLWKPTF